MELTEKDIFKFIIFLIINDGNLSKTASAVHYNRETIRKYLKEEKGLFPYKVNEINLLNDKNIPYLIEFSEEGGTPITKEDIPKIIGLDKEYNGNLYKAESESPYSWHPIKVVWGLDGRPIKYNKIPIEPHVNYEDRALYRFLELCRICSKDAKQAGLEITRDGKHGLGPDHNFLINLWRYHKLIPPKKEGQKEPRRLSSIVSH